MSLKCCIMVWLFQGIQNNCSATETLKNGVYNYSLLPFQPRLKGKKEQKLVKFMFAIKKPVLSSSLARGNAIRSNYTASGCVCL